MSRLQWEHVSERYEKAVVLGGYCTYRVESIGAGLVFASFAGCPIKGVNETISEAKGMCEKHWEDLLNKTTNQGASDENN